MNNKMTELEQFFRKNEGRLIHKWNHYFDIYDRHFSRFRDKEITILEIGVSHGGSLQMWKHYFGNKAKIYGVDINPKCKEFEEENIEIFIGSQSDRNFLRQIVKSIPEVDILIDDGGHTMKQQIVSYEELFGHIKKDGVYLCEDLHTSYWLKFGGGHKRRNTFIEYSKDFIDYLNAFHSEQNSLKVNSFSRSVDSIHYYDSIMVIEKRPKEPPFHEKTGKESFSVTGSIHKSTPKRVLTKIQFGLLYAINQLLRFFRLPGFIWK
ncbi:MAG: class I SAM-dependent methyltransferase [Bacteroidota bacterium]